MSDMKEKRIIAFVSRLLAERDILDPNMTVDEVVEKRFDCPTPEVRLKLTKVVHEFRENGKVDWKRKIEEQDYDRQTIHQSRPDKQTDRNT